MRGIPGHLTRRWPLALAGGLVLASLWGLRRWNEHRLYSAAREEAERAAREAVPVKAYRVRPRDVSGTLRRIGTVRARAETNLQFGAPGRVSRFEPERGQFVKKGSLVAALDQAEAQNALQTAELEFQRAAEKYFKDRTIDRLDYERAKARYTQVRLEAAKTLIQAPHDGYLVERWVNVGEHVDPGTVIGKIMDKTRVFVDADLSEDDIRHLKLGLAVEVTVDAVPDYRGQGKVSAITPYLKGENRSFNVKVELPQDPDEKLNPGMFARLAIRRYEKKGALVVPLEAGAEVQGESLRLFRVLPDNRVESRTAGIVFMDEGLVEISGLSAEDLVVLHPGADLADGTQVSVTDVFDPDAHAPAGP